MMITEIFFWIALIFLVYAYFGYPIAIVAIAKLFPKKIRKEDYFPSITFIIAAFNEEKVIAEKLRETIELDYPQEKLEIIVASDGSTDGTEQIVSDFPSPIVRLIRSGERKGKTNIQNIAAEHAQGEILLFTDATTKLQSDAIKKMVGNFSDPSVGCVAGKLIFRDLKTIDKSDRGHEKNLIMAYEQGVRHFESVTRTTFGVDGCFYAVRKELYRLMPLDVASDFALPLEIVAGGSRVVFEDEARCFEEPPPSREYEFNRKIRTASRGIYSLFKMKRLLNPFRYGAISVMLFSHKVLRWLSVYFLFILMIANIVAYKISLFYKSFLFLQVIFYIFVFLGHIAGDKMKFKIAKMPYNFFMLNLSSLLGMINALRGKMKITWDTLR